MPRKRVPDGSVDELIAAVLEQGGEVSHDDLLELVPEGVNASYLIAAATGSGRLQAAVRSTGPNPEDRPTLVYVVTGE